MLDRTSNDAMVLNIKSDAEWLLFGNDTPDGEIDRYNIRRRFDNDIEWFNSKMNLKASIFDALDGDEKQTEELLYGWID